MKNGKHEPNQHTPPDSDSPSSESRRSFFKATSAAILTAPAILTSRKTKAQAVTPPTSPPTTPWLEDLPQAIEPLQQTDLLADPERTPQVAANTIRGECGRNDHQRWDEFFASPQLQANEADLYELRAKANNNYIFHPDYGPQLAWNYVGIAGNGAPYFNPVFHARYGQPVIVRLYNELPSNHTGFGTPEISMHLHNLHAPSESDGFPGDYFSKFKVGPTMLSPGDFKDYFYPNIYAGFDEFPKGPDNPVGGDMREALGTLWYHDHTLDFTAANAARGMAGFYLLYDELDSGDENDPNPAALRLPSHPYDYPLAFQDKLFDANGAQFFDQLDPIGTSGDKITVNGKIEPVLHVEPRKYRLRLLNAGPRQFYEFYLVNSADVAQPFTYIANDGNLLPAPLLNRTRVLLDVAERGDIIVDFAKFAFGTDLYFVNRITPTSDPGIRVLKIMIDIPLSGPDNSQVPAVLRPIRRPSAEEIAAAPVRRWDFVRRNGLWTVNNKLVNVNSASAHIAKGNFEIWELNNPSAGVRHPIHIHFEEGHILQRFNSGIPVAVPVHERGRKDVFSLGGNQSARIFMRFRDFSGKYVMHCHNMIHEDHGMMVRWDIVD
ncbi:MAG: multicopper oxidase domain-containing protein [Nitrosomonas sp.]|nr:MAG: multicopper oxidase domain-containing protein [Nitrosomonas sp.]